MLRTFANTATRRALGRLSFNKVAATGIVQWRPSLIANRHVMVLEEMEMLRDQIEMWSTKNNAVKMIMFDKCEFLFQDEKNATEGCWLENLAMLYDYDLNKVSCRLLISADTYQAFPVRFTIYALLKFIYFGTRWRRRSTSDTNW